MKYWSSRFSSRTEFNSVVLVLRSRSFVFPVKAFKIFVQDRFRQRLRLFTLLLVLTSDANEPGDGVFRTFPHGKKVRSAGQVSADLPRHISSWTPAAYEQSRGSHEQEVEIEKKKKAEYERRMIDINQRVADGLPIGPKEYEAWRRFSGLPPSSSYSSGKRRKRKKRSKRKLSKSSSGVRIRRYVHRFRSRSSSSRCVPSLRPLVSGSLLFAVLLGSTVDTYYVSLQRLLWHLLRGDHHLSSIFARTVWHVVNYAVLGPDSQAIRGLYASVHFSDKVVFLPGVGQRLALMVQTVLKPVQFSQVHGCWTCPLWAKGHGPSLRVLLQCRNPWSSHRCFSWTRMLTCSLLCQTGFWSRRADNSGNSAVAVLHQGCGHARRCAMTVASLDVQKTAEVSAVAVHGVTG